MTPERFAAITDRYSRLRLAVVGDFCLDRYLEIDPARAEVSIETGLPVHNVVNVRAQPGGAGTVLNNLVALGVGTIFPVGFVGEDGEGYELRRALAAKPGVRLDHFLETAARCTFTYCKPLVCAPGQPPQELNRLDRKNWAQTPVEVSRSIAAAVDVLASQVDAFVLLSQVDQSGTGVLTTEVLRTVAAIAAASPHLLILADSRHGLGGFPPVVFKMNAAELTRLTGVTLSPDPGPVGQLAVQLAKQNGRPVVVTLAERGIVGASPDGQTEHIPSLPVRGAIDIVGAGDAVTANLVTALSAGAGLREAVELANAAASIVIHQLGTTGTAAVAQLRELLSLGPGSSPRRSKCSRRRSRPR